MTDGAVARRSCLRSISERAGFNSQQPYNVVTEGEETSPCSVKASQVGSSPIGHPIWVWVNGWPLVLGTRSCRFESCHPDNGECSGEQRCLASNSRRVQLPHSPQSRTADVLIKAQCSASERNLQGPKLGEEINVRVWVGALRRADGLQNRPTRFESSLTRTWKAPLNGRQSVLKTEVVVDSPKGSIPSPSSSGDVPEW